MTPVFLVIALFPGALAWLSSRGLAKLKDDPALPELLFARRARITNATWIAVIATSFADDSLYRFALFVLSVASPFAGSYPLGQKLFGYTIGFGGYLWRGFKSLVAGLGPLLVLIYAPSIVESVPEPWRVLVLLLVPVMIAWNWWFTQVWLALNDARPLTDPELRLRIDNIARRATVRPPSLWVFGSEEMKVVNAVALRGPRPAIALGNGLVELLEPDEVAAVYAHEIAHIEQIPERELRLWRLVNWALVVVGFAGFYLAVERFSSAALSLLSLAWTLVIIALLVVQTKRGKRHETEGDLRAAELTGSSDLVARALVKIHVHGLIPRRWSLNFEKTATHPSLSRRIQSLRGSGISAPAEAKPTVIQTKRPSRVVAFDATRAYWFDGVPEGTQRELNALREQASGMRSASWNDLVELRIAAESEEDRALVATHKNGETWSVPIAKSDVAAVQRLLDQVDTQLHGRLQKSVSRYSPRTILGAAALITLFTSPGLTIAPLVVGLFKPSTAIMAGAGGVMAVDAALRMKEGSILPGYYGLVPPIISMLLAAVLIVFAYQRAKDDRRDGLQFTLILLGVGAALSVAGDSYGGLASCLAGIGVALLLTARRAARIGGGLSLAAGLGAAVMTIAPIGATDVVSTETAQLREVRRVPFPARMITGRLDVSPGGRGILVQVAGREDARGRMEWQLSYDDSLWIMPAIDAGFVDSTHVISLWPSGDSLELRMERLDTTFVEWVMPLAPLEGAKLTTRPGNRSWAVVGHSGRSDSLVIVSGALDQDEAPIRTVASIDSMLPGIVLPGPDGRSVVGVRMSLGDKTSLIKSLMMRRGFTSELWESSEKGRRLLGEIEGMPICGGSGSAAVRCMTIGAKNVTFWRFAGDTVEKEAAVPLGQFYRTDLGSSGLVSMLNFDGNQVQFGDPVTHSLLRATAPVGDASITTATAAPGKLWVAVLSAEKISVIEYMVQR